MKKEQQHINLLRRWVSGEITANEERELEAAAQQDEALRDAWAGYQSHAGADHEARLAKLRGRLTQKEQKPVRILLPWMRIAAAIALLLVAAWVVFQTPGVGEDALATNQAEAPVEAKKDMSTTDAVDDTFETEKMVEASPTNATPATTIETTSADNTSPLPTTSAEAETISLAKAEESVTSDYESAGGMADANAGTLAESTPATLEGMNDAAEETVILESTPIAQDEIVTAAPPPPPSPITPNVYNTQSQAVPPARLEDRSATSNSGVRVPNAGYRIINGYVTDEQGNPLIGASILEEGSTNGTVADIDGYYELTVSNQSKKLLVNYTGYETATVRIGEEAEISIVLGEGRQLLDEVVVTGLGARNNRQSYETEEDEVTGDATPLGGFSELRQYLRTNAPDNAGRANVKIRFYVQADGRPANASIISSTNPALNSEATRLIEEGPTWVITTGSAPVEVTYTVKFR